MHGLVSLKKSNTFEFANNCNSMFDGMMAFSVVSFVYCIVHSRPIKVSISTVSINQYQL
jgi:hypothetical protein